MAGGRDRRHEKVRWTFSERVITLAGIVLMLTPLTLWISPTTGAFLGWLAACALAYLSIVALVLWQRWFGRAPDPGFRPAARPELSVELITALQNGSELSRRHVPLIRRVVDEELRPDC